jgi:hypothetical protein
MLEYPTQLQEMQEQREAFIQAVQAQMNEAMKRLAMGPVRNDAGMILHGDCLEQLRAMPADSVDCCVTSPPYWGLRDYGVSGQLGLEKTGVVAQKHGRKWIGIELNADYIEIARKRLDHERRPADLFTTAGDRLTEDSDSSSGSGT